MAVTKTTKAAPKAEAKAAEAKAYEVPKGEENHIHLAFESSDYDRRSGKKKSKPRLQKYSKPAFQDFKGSAHSLGINRVQFLHVPKGVDATLDERIEIVDDLV